MSPQVGNQNKKLLCECFQGKLLFGPRRTTTLEAEKYVNDETYHIHAFEVQDSMKI